MKVADARLHAHLINFDLMSPIGGWKTAVGRYSNRCEANGIPRIDLAGFRG
jgi:hypothetical protein